MSQILKALNKAQKEHTHDQQAHDSVRVDQYSSDHKNDGSLLKQVDMHIVFLGVLIVLVGIGIYLNYNISLKLASTQNRMVFIADNFKAQQDKLTRLNELMLQMDTANNGQSREFLTKIDKLGANVETQIAEVKKMSESQYSELSKTIDDQQKSIANLTDKYEQLNKSVSNYTVVNDRYIEQLNMLKKKMAELNLGHRGE